MNNKITIDDIRLLEILEQVSRDECLPIGITNEEELELVGEDKLIWGYDFPRGLWLTQKGRDIMLSLQSQKKDGRNSFNLEQRVSAA